jgi:hypothetical protein
MTSLPWTAKCSNYKGYNIVDGVCGRLRQSTRQALQPPLVQWPALVIRRRDASRNIWWNHAVLPPLFAHAALLESVHIHAPGLIASEPSAEIDVTKTVNATAARAAAYSPPCHAMARLAALKISAMPLSADRLDTMERVGSILVGPLHYVDDATTLRPSIDMAKAVLKRDGASTCHRSAKRMKAAFTSGP